MHPARRYNYLLGGDVHFAVDRAAGEELARVLPAVRDAVRANRDAHRRIVRYLAAEAGVRQFLDVGTGIPAPDNTHEVARAVAADCRVVYVDNDPLVTANAESLRAGGAYLEADMREPAAIVDRAGLDPARPVAVLLISVLHFIKDDGEADAVVRGLVDPLPAGSYLAMTHTTWDLLDSETLGRARAMTKAGRTDAWPRTYEQIHDFFRGFDIVSPGVVPTTRWRPDADTAQYPLHHVPGWAAVGRKR